MVKNLFANGVTEWYVAESPEHAAQLCEALGKEQGLDPSEMDLNFTAVADHVELSCLNEETGERQTKTAAQWAADNGYGFLMTTEY